MNLSISPALRQASQEATIIGALVLGYGELEFCWAHVLGAVLQDRDTAFRILYCDRGEDRRINLCNVMMRPHFKKIYRSKSVTLEHAFCATIDQTRTCKDIRNQYAHAWWTWTAHTPSTGTKAGKRDVSLRFVSLEDASKRTTKIDAKPRRVDVPLLEIQAAYFENTYARITWLRAMVEDIAANKPIKELPREPPILEKPLPYVGWKKGGNQNGE